MKSCATQPTTVPAVTLEEVRKVAQFAYDEMQNLCACQIQQLLAIGEGSMPEFVSFSVEEFMETYLYNPHLFIGAQYRMRTVEELRRTGKLPCHTKKVSCS
ncbi:hypothetical protein HC891_21625 [Candidatus Gracilibacteria bacterium]|nr:hypothetical protein [Candidatus Gracilibacteria bacterium]